LSQVRGHFFIKTLANSGISPVDPGLVGEAGIRQLLDIGTGIPKENNVHEVAQQVAPESRIVYVDYDPVVLAHTTSRP
jgi:hypothetical protein